MQHYIIFMTANGPCLVFVCVENNIDIAYVLKERAMHEKFNNENDVKVFMDKYISDTKKPNYCPYWQFVEISTVV